MPQNQRTILLVSDSQETRETYCRYLVQEQQDPYRILEADSGGQALSICSEQFPDAVLLDEVLPDLEMLEVLRQLKSCPGADVPVVMLMEQENEDIAVAAIKGGASSVLIKGKTKKETLRLTIAHAIERKRLNLELENYQDQFCISVENMLDCCGIYSSIRNSSGEIVDFKIEYVNVAACNSSGMAATDQIGKCLHQLLPSYSASALKICETLFDECCRVVETGEPLNREVLLYEDAAAQSSWFKAFNIFVSKLDDGFVASWHDITARKQAEEVLQRQLMRQRLVTDMLERIRQSLDLCEILNTTVEEVRQFLDTDRVIIFRFEPDWSGTVMVESVGSQWSAILSTTHHDPCFNKPQEGASYVDRYRQGRVMAATDIYTAGLQTCHLELLANFQVRANLVVPILQGEHLWGLLIAHHCRAPRQWQFLEIDWLQQLAMQVGIAIQQSTLYEQVQSELIERQQVEVALRQARDSLERRVLERTAELANANEELQATLEELQAAQENLHQQNEALLAAREMAESERQRYQDLFSEAPDGYLVTDIEGNIQEANRAAATLLRVHSSRLVGKPLVLFIAKPDRKAFQTRLAQLQPVQAWEIHLQPRSGNPFPAELSMTSLCNSKGQPVGLRWLLRDISDRKRAEQKIQEQAALIDISTDAIFVQDLENRILFWSQGAERLYGWKATDILEEKAHELFNEECLSQLEAILNTTVENSIWQGELEQVTKDSRKIIVESRWTLMYDRAGHPQSILIVNTDVTEKKHLEAQFYRAQRLESIGTLASGIAHDLNNLLQPILFTVHLLRRNLSDLDERTQERLKILEDSSKQGAALVKQISSFASGEEGSYTSVPLGHLLQEVVQVAQRTFLKSIEIYLNVPKDLWTVYADATQLHQVFMNLIVNARDAMPTGGTLSLAADNLFIDETYARIELEANVGCYVVITVTDTGTGISPEIMERIFDPFFTTKEPGKGTGLGLATVMRIVKNHGGFVRVTSAVGKGSQFKVYLLAVEGEERQPAQELELPDGQNELILIVDDEVSIREIAKTSLEEHNYRCLTAKDGSEAINLYTKYHADVSVVLMDLIMPEMDGVTAIHTMQKINPQLKTIVTSGLESKNKLSKAASIDGSIFLSKPYTVKELLDTLRNLISR